MIFAPSAHAQKLEAGSSAALVPVPAHTNVNIVSHRDTAQDLIVKRRVLTKVLEAHNSPLVGSVDAFMATCTSYSLNCYLLPSITRLESSFGQFTHPGSNNPFGWGGGYILFPSWADAIQTVGKGLRYDYIDRGADTIDAIGRKYAASPTWSIRVERFIAEFERLEEASLQAENISL